MSFRTEERVGDLAPDPAVTLRAEAFAWGWRFSYDGQEVTVVSDPTGENVTGPEIALPRGETVRVVLTSDDVIHAFWVPDFLFKRDAIPGHVNRVRCHAHRHRDVPRRLRGVLRAEPRVHDVPRDRDGARRVRSLARRTPG